MEKMMKTMEAAEQAAKQAAEEAAKEREFYAKLAREWPSGYVPFFEWDWDNSRFHSNGWYKTNMLRTWRGAPIPSGYLVDVPVKAGMLGLGRTWEALCNKAYGPGFERKPDDYIWTLVSWYEAKEIASYLRKKEDWPSF